jgi:hypothetical protein
MITRRMILSVIVLFFISGCTPATPLPEINPQPTPLLETNSIDQLNETAFTAYPIAEAEALRWNPDAVFYQIPLTRVMESNLGLPPGGPGWFFMFMVPGSPVEFYVEIVDGKFIRKSRGPTHQAWMHLHMILLPIDINSSLINSNAVLQIYLDNGGREYFEGNTQFGYHVNYRLIHVKGTDNPIWSIFDTEQDTSVPLISIDAVNSEIVEDPLKDIP